MKLYKNVHSFLCGVHRMLGNNTHFYVPYPETMRGLTKKIKYTYKNIENKVRKEF